MDDGMQYNFSGVGSVYSHTVYDMRVCVCVCVRVPVHSCMNTFMSRMKTYVIGYDCIAIDLCGNHSTSQPTKNKTDKASTTNTTLVIATTTTTTIK